jgi:hypothetical protein
LKGLQPFYFVFSFRSGRLSRIAAEQLEFASWMKKVAPTITETAHVVWLKDSSFELLKHRVKPGPRSVRKCLISKVPKLSHIQRDFRMSLK